MWANGNYCFSFFLTNKNSLHTHRLCLPAHRKSGSCMALHLCHNQREQNKQLACMLDYFCAWFIYRRARNCCFKRRKSLSARASPSHVCAGSPCAHNFLSSGHARRPLPSWKRLCARTDSLLAQRKSGFDRLGGDNCKPPPDWALQTRSHRK